MLKINTTLAYQFDEPTDILLQLEAALIPEQTVTDHHIDIGGNDHFARVEGHCAIGDRIWLRAHNLLTVSYRSYVTIGRLLADVATLPALETYLLPGETIDFLMPSRFCPSDRFGPFVEDEFGSLAGGVRIAAIRDWVAQHITYKPGSSDAFTSASEALVDRAGVCRDFAHLVITMARASAIPARYVSVYAPDVTPQDFHAVAEVFLGGAWHMVDATGMSTPADTAKIGVGRDAADVPFLSSFGNAVMVEQVVKVERMGRVFPK